MSNNTKAPAGPFDNSRFYSVLEIARVLAVSRSHAYNLLNSGLPSCRFGAARRTLGADLNRYVEASRLA